MSTLTQVTPSMLTPQQPGRRCTLARLTLARLAALTLTCLCLSIVSASAVSAQESPDELELDTELDTGLDTAPAPRATQPGAQPAPSPRAQASNPKDEGDSDSARTSKGQVKVEKLPPQVQAQPSRGAEVYQQQIAQIEAQVNELKEEVFRSRTRLDILKETVLAIGLSGSEVTIIHRNEMGANFKLESVYYMIDDTDYSISKKTHPDFDTREEIVIYDGPLSSENHTIQVELVYRGNGFGVFSYLQSYLFTLNNVHTFKAEEGKRTIIKGIGYEKGGTLEFTERPALRFDQSEVDLEQKKRPTGE